MSLRFAYNSNGLQNHRLPDAAALVAEAGYDGLDVSLDIHHLDPFADDLPGRARALRRRLDELELGCVVETGARFLLDPRAKHEPTLVSPEPDGRRRRVEFLFRALEAAAELEAEAVGFWAGVPRAGVDTSAAWDWVVAGTAEVLARGTELGVTVAFEPEPGMLVETVDDWRRLRDAVAGAGGDGLKLALDTGHCLVTGERDPADAVREFASDLATVAVEDMRRGEHVHLPFGEGDLDLPAVLAALDEVGFERLVCVELSRDSHRAHTMVPAALEALRAAAPA